MGSINDLLETRRLTGLSTTLHIIRGHTNIRGNDPADAAAMEVFAHFETLRRRHRHNWLTSEK